MAERSGMGGIRRQVPEYKTSLEPILEAELGLQKTPTPSTRE